MKHDISKLLRNKELSMQVSPEEVFGSAEFKQYLEQLGEATTKRYMKPPKIVLKHDGKEGAVACTDNNSVQLNLDNSLVAMLSGLPAKFKCLLGIFFHELAHMIYLDFDGEAECGKQIKNGMFPIARPTTGDPADIEEMEGALKNPGWQSLFVRIYHELANFASDSHDESKMIAAYRGFGRDDRASLVEQCIKRARTCLEVLSPPLEQMLEKSDGKITFSLMMCLIFQYIRFGYVLVRERRNQDHEAMKRLETFKADADIAVTTDSTSEKFAALNRIVVKLWPLIREEIRNKQKNQNQNQSQSQSQQAQGQQAQSQQGQGQQSQGQQSQSQQAQGQQGQDQQAQSQQGQGQQGEDSQGPGQEDLDSTSLEELLGAIADAARDAGESRTPTGRKSSSASQKCCGHDAFGGCMEQKAGDRQNDAPEKDASRSAAQEQEKDGRRSEENESQQHANIPSKQPRRVDDADQDEDECGQAHEALSSLLEPIKRAKAVDCIAKELADETLGEIWMVNAAGPHRDIVLAAERVGPANAAAVELYKKLYSEIGAVSRRMQRKIKAELQDVEVGSYTRHLEFGRRFDARDVYRPDGKFYSNKKLPDRPVEMAVLVLIDMSGSMTLDGRSEAARLAGILLDDFCRGLDIPVMVAGHWAYGGYPKANFTVYTDFDQLDPKAKYRLAAIAPSSNSAACNRDGMAIEIACGLLANRPEPVKLLFVISDGQPSHVHYREQRAAKDIQSIVTKYRKKGVETIAAAIGSDKEKIQAIYKDCFLDITDLPQLPKTLACVLKKRIKEMLAI